MYTEGLFSLSIHRDTASLELQEALAFSASDRLDLLLAARDAGAAEVVIVSTAGTLEVYASQGHVEAFRVLLAAVDNRGRGLAGFGELRVTQSSGGATVRQLFRTCAGSGRTPRPGLTGLSDACFAVDLAAQAGTLGPLLEALFHRGMNAAWRARCETAFGRSLGATEDLDTFAVERILEEELTALRSTSMSSSEPPSSHFNSIEPRSLVRVRTNPPALTALVAEN